MRAIACTKRRPCQSKRTAKIVTVGTLRHCFDIAKVVSDQARIGYRLTPNDLYLCAVNYDAHGLHRDSE